MGFKTPFHQLPYKIIFLNFWHFWSTIFLTRLLRGSTYTRVHTEVLFHFSLFDYSNRYMKHFSMNTYFGLKKSFEFTWILDIRISNICFETAFRAWMWRESLTLKVHSFTFKGIHSKLSTTTTMNKKWSLALHRAPLSSSVVLNLLDP